MVLVSPGLETCAWLASVLGDSRFVILSDPIFISIKDGQEYLLTWDGHCEDDVTGSRLVSSVIVKPW